MTNPDQQIDHAVAPMVQSVNTEPDVHLERLSSNLERFHIVQLLMQQHDMTPDQVKDHAALTQHSARWD
jgi:hypothetical protein